MNIEKYAVIKFYPKENEWKDITDDVIKYEYKQEGKKKPYYDVYYRNGNKFPDTLENFIIYSAPVELNVTNYVYFHNNIPLFHIKKFWNLMKSGFMCFLKMNLIKVIIGMI